MKRFLSTLLVAACFTVFTGAATMPEVTRVIVSPAVVLGVTDGDTLTVAIMGTRSFVGAVRLRQVFAKEGSSSARENLVRLMPRLSKVRVSQTYSSEGNGTESLCRPVVDVWVEASGLHINEAQTKWLKAHRLWGGVGK